MRHRDRERRDALRFENRGKCFLGSAAAAVGIAAGLNSLMNSGSSASSGPGGYSAASGAPPLYQPTGVGGADQLWQGLLSQLTQNNQGVSGQVNPALLQSFQNQAGLDPSGMLAAANLSGQASTQLGGLDQLFAQMMQRQYGGNIDAANALRGAGANAFSAGANSPLNQIVPGIMSNLTGAGNASLAAGQDPTQAGIDQGLQQFMISQAGNAAGAGDNLYGAGNQAYLTGFDPQNALYERTLQQVQDQARSADSARGIAMSPTSAALEDQATRNFNIDWQNNQLSRQLSALSGMGGAYSGAAGQNALAGADVSSAANLGQMPLEALLAGISGANTAYGGATAAGRAPLEQLLAGLQGYSGASGVANQTGALAGQNLGAAQQFAGMAPAAFLSGGTTPYQTAFNAYGMPGQAAQSYISGTAAANQPYASLMSSIIPYLNYGQGANANAYGAFTGQQQFNQNTAAQGMNALLTGLQGQYSPWTGTYSGGLQNNAWIQNMGNWGNPNVYGYGGGGTVDTSGWNSNMDWGQGAF